MGASREHLQRALAGRYEIEREIGRGGMATVFLARDTKHKRLVAVKVLDPELAESLGGPRFLREVELAARLTHPHIVPLHDSGAADGVLYYVMPFITGETLRARLERESALPVDVASRVIGEAASALDYAHREGVVHRDVKPENVLLHEGHALLTDFGVARAVSRATQGASPEALTQTGFAVGTPAYMSPEQAVGERDLSGTSDVYSLGCVAYELLTGRTPYAGSGTEQAAKRLTTSPPAASSVRPDLPVAIDAVFDRVLALRPTDRYATPGEFAADLEKALHATSPTAVAPSPDNRRWTRRLVMGGIAAAAMVSAVWVASLRDPRPSVQGIATDERKMIAVLPFKNLGAPEDDYVANGVTEEVTSRLASLPGLGVISRTSTDQYKDTKKSLKEIARELGVDYVLEGGVRRARLSNPQSSDRVLVTPQLIRVSDDSHIWTDRIDENAVDLFAVQARIAERVAAALDVTLGASDRAALTRAPTANFSAYNEYLRGLAVESRQNRESVLQAVRLYEEATRLDSTFALAYVRLAEAHLSLYGMFGDGTDERLTQLRSAIDAALRLDPDLPEARIALAMFYIFPATDYERAETELARVDPRRRNTSEGWAAKGTLDAFRGRWTEARASAERAVELDPRSSKAIWNAVIIFTLTRDYSHVKRYLERLRVVAPEDVSVYVYEAYVDATLGESLETARSLLQEARRRYGLARVVAAFTLTPTMPVDLLGLLEPNQLAGIDSLRLSVRDFGGDSAAFYMVTASLHHRQGRAHVARVYYDSLRLFAVPKLAGPAPSMVTRGYAAFAYAGLGRKGDALREAQTLVKLRPPSEYPTEGVLVTMLLARIEALVGEKEAAIDHIEYLLSVPSAVSVPMLRVESTWDSLRDHPRFQRLLEQRR